MYLHLFYPENDLALAQNSANYTAPPAAVKLRRAGATLPLWYGGEGDKVIIDGLNARWYNAVCSKFNLKTALYGDFSSGMRPLPWGWSKASRHIFELRGVPSDSLPSDKWLDRVRELSHRRTAAAVATALQARLPFTLAPAARELGSFDEIKSLVSAYGEAVFKLPWSSSGRGVIPVNAADIERQRQAIEGAVRRQGSVMVEPRYDKVLDFAALFEISGGKCAYQGLSVFDTTGFGSYAGNVLATEEELHGMISRALGGAEQFDAVIEALPGILQDIIREDYDGPLGVDMMAVRNAGFTLAPAIELNLRMTMGHVCHRFYRDFVVSGARGRFTVGATSTAGIIDCEMDGARMSRGRLDLAQPGSDFSFIVELS